MPASSQLLSDFNDLRREDPTLRAVDAAARLGVSEGALAEARAGAGEVVGLAPSGPAAGALVEGLNAVGRVMTLTRNETAVHETKGTLGAVNLMGAMGQVTGAIDLRLFFRHWHAAYHMTEETKSGLRHSFQVFGPDGRSVLKVFALDETDKGAWQALATEHADGGREVTFAPLPPADPDRPDGEIDVDALRAGWQSLEHSHDFFGLLGRLGVGRQQALRLGGVDLAEPLPERAAVRLLEAASAGQVPIMCFVGNPGCIQIFSGPVTRIAEMGPWINVLDPAFNLHMRLDRVAAAWLVRKPTSSRGLITSVELFDASGEMVCQFFGVRKPGEGENPAWRALAEGLVGEIA